MGRTPVIDALIFDYDGVLADTEPLHWRSWAEILAPLGIEFTWDRYCEIGRGIHDARMLDSLRQLVQDPSVLSPLEEQNALRRAMIRDMCESEPPICGSTIAMLHSLKEYRLGLVTSSAESDVQPVLRATGILQCFDALVFGEDVGCPKPAPDPYFLVSKLLGTKAGLVFEDSDAGITSAQQAGFAVTPITEPGQLSRIVLREISRFPNYNL
jgi:beta-phosphoglucomutase